MHGRRLNLLERAWLLDGLLAFARDPDLNLDAALGLAGPGRRHVYATVMLRQRNAHLAAALGVIAADDAVSTWARCERLARHVPELVAAWNRHYRHVALPPTAWPAWKRHTFLAWRTGRKIPATARGLHEALKKSDISVQSPTGRLAPFIQARGHHDGEVVRHPGAR